MSGLEPARGTFVSFFLANFACQRVPNPLKLDFPL